MDNQEEKPTEERKGEAPTKAKPKKKKAKSSTYRLETVEEIVDWFEDATVGFFWQNEDKKHVAIRRWEDKELGETPFSDTVKGWLPADLKEAAEFLVNKGLAVLVMNSPKAPNYVKIVATDRYKRKRRTKSAKETAEEPED